MNLSLALESSATKHAGKVAILYGTQEISYAALFGQSVQVAHQLLRKGQVQPGDRVGIWMKNCPEFVPSLFGILLAGGVVVPINNFLKPNEVSFILQDAGVHVLIAEPAHADAVVAINGLRTGQPPLTTLLAEPFAIENSAADFPGTHLPGRARLQSDLAVIIYTSGTTGHPKGAMLSHGNLLANVESCRQVLQTVDLDRFVVLLPMFHSFMLCVGVFLPMLAGCSMVVIKSLHPPKSILAEILHHQATILPAIPQFFRTLASVPLPPGFPLRLCVSGGAPLPGEILREFNAKMPIPLIEGYGLSEASPVVSMNPLRGPIKEGSIGIPIPNVEVTIQNDAGQILPSPERGELCVRGANVMQGYWNQPEETAKVLRQGWLCTGDIGFQDSDGYFFITDRKKDMLLVNGINVYPREIEEIIYQFPGIKEAAVLGMADPKRGETPVAFVALNEGTPLDEKELLQFVRARLADYKVPRRVHVLPALPRNATGKILKTALRQLE